MFKGETNRLDLDCGIAYARIAAWLDDELALSREDGSWVFHEASQPSRPEHTGQTCRITLEALENRTFRRVSIERTRLVAEGDAGALESFEKLFTLRFISAGG